MGTGDGIFPGDICRWGKVAKRQKLVLRGTNSRRLIKSKKSKLFPGDISPGIPLLVLKALKNSLEALKVLKNSLEVLNVLQSNLESMELQENSSIHENNEHNEPTQGDISETSNEPTQATRNEFEELYASANEELYPGCDYAYSMWPVILTTYNLPPWLCMKESSFMLTLLIPGPKSPGKDIDVYLRPLIEDLKVLWDRKGVETIDVASGQRSSIWVELMVFYEPINDFPARSWFVVVGGYQPPPPLPPVGKVTRPCPTVNEDTPSVRVLSKTAYVGHRRFLKKPHKWRSSREFNGQTDNRDPPKEFGRDKILAQLDRLPTRLTGKHPSYGGVKIKRNVVVELNWTKRQDLQRLGIRSGLWLGQTKNGKCLKPQAAYSFTPEDRKKFCQFIKGVKLPDGFGSCFKHKVTDNDTNITGLKSHDCYFPNKDMKEEFPTSWARMVDGVEVCCALPAVERAHQNNGNLFAGPDGVSIYGQLQEILEIKYLLFKVVLFRVKWFDTHNQRRKVKRLVLKNNMTQIDTRGEAFKNDQYILVTQVKQVFYLEDKAKPYWKVVEHVNHKRFSDGGVIVVEDVPDIIHFDNSSDLLLFTSLNDLDNATLHINGQPTEVDALLDIIDVVDKDDDIIDDLFVVVMMSADVARSHGGNGGGEDRPPPHHVPTGRMGCFANRGKGKRKPNLSGRAAGRLNIRDKTRNLSLKEITDKKAPYIGEVIRGVPLYYPSWLKVPKERKAALITDIGHLQKEYNTNKAAFKAQHWVIDPTAGTYDVEKIRRARPEDITVEEGRAQALRSTHRSLTPSSWQTFNVKFLQDEDRRIYEEIRRLEAMGTYTDDEINRLARRGKQRGHIPGVGRVLPARATAGPSTPTFESMLNSLHKKVDFIISLFKSDSKYSDMFSQFESSGASGSGGCRDDEESADAQEDEDEDGDGDS
ncbi:F-box domain containing protein [Tanacetum coccineum]